MWIIGVIGIVLAVAVLVVVDRKYLGRAEFKDYVGGSGGRYEKWYPARGKKKAK